MECIHKYFICTHCNKLTPKDDAKKIVISPSETHWLCPDCIENVTPNICSICGEDTYADTHLHNGDTICPELQDGE